MLRSAARVISRPSLKSALPPFVFHRPSLLTHSFRPFLAPLHLSASRSWPFTFPAVPLPPRPLASPASHPMCPEHPLPSPLEPVVGLPATLCNLTIYSRVCLWRQAWAVAFSNFRTMRLLFTDSHRDFRNPDMGLLLMKPTSLSAPGDVSKGCNLHL